MDKSFDGMHEKYDLDSIRCSVKKTISISMIVTSVVSTVEWLAGRTDVTPPAKDDVAKDDVGTAYNL